MPRTRKPSAFPLGRIESPPSRLGIILSSETGTVAADCPRTSRDPMKFVRVMAEIERLRRVRVHPESPTLH
jgi:hypothetical protein